MSAIRITKARISAATLAGLMTAFTYQASAVPRAQGDAKAIPSGWR